jgi:hypothetical protein
MKGEWKCNYRKWRIGRRNDGKWNEGKGRKTRGNKRGR